MTAPTWPPILTNADWQKKKGAIAKVAGKTGIGEAMTAAQKSFAKIDWSKFDARTAIPLPHDRDPDNIVKAKNNVMQLYKTTVEPARAELQKVRDLANKRAAEWKNNKLIPSASTKHVAEVAKAAEVFSMTLKGNSPKMTAYLKSFDEMLAVKKRQEQDEIKKLDTSIAALEAALKEAAKDPTKKFWSSGNTSAHQRCRSMCNAIRNIPALKAKYWATWSKFGDDYHKDAPEGPNEAAAMKKKIATVSQELAKFKADYKKVMA